MVISDYQLKTGGYQGPIEKLVELIDEKKLPITEVSLAEVTADFLSYIETLEAKAAEGSDEERALITELLADFLVVASRLILIKSKVLLPSIELSEEEAEDIRDLEARVRLYRELKGVQPLLKEGWREVPQMFVRDLLLATEPIFYPPPQLTVSDLHGAVARMAGVLERIARPLQTVRGTVIHLKEKIEEIVERVKQIANISFGELTKGRSRGEAVVLFLATLHLIKAQLVRVTQNDRFAEITIAKREAETQ